MTKVRYFLLSERLGFRHWTIEDLPLAITLWGDPRVTKYIDTRERLSEPEVCGRLESEIAMQNKHGIQYWPIFLRNEQEFIGCCGLRPYNEKDVILEIGAHICFEHWREGYAEEAVRAVIPYAFDQLGAEALFAGHNPKNEASRSFLAKLGFRYTHDEDYEPTGLMHPSYLLTCDKYYNSIT